MATPVELLAQSLTALRNAKRFSHTSNSYRKDNPNEYAKVIAYLDGGARPSGVTSEMGKHAVMEEDVRRSLLVLPPDPPDPPPTTIQRYAARTGSDSNPGTLAQPYLTANKLFNSLQPGETGALREGIYDEHPQGRYAVYMTAAGSTAKADGITVIAYPGETVEIRGPGKIYRNWLRMEGIKINARPFDDARDQVWWVIGDDNHYYGCEFTNNHPDGTFYDSKGSAMFLGGSGSEVCNRLIIERCIFRDVLWDGIGNQPHGMYCGFSDGLIVRNSKFWNIGVQKDGQFAIQFWGGNHSARIHNNIFDHVNSAHVLGDAYGGTCSDNVFEKNICSSASYYQSCVYGLSGARNIVRDNHHWQTPSFVSGTGVTESGTTQGDPIYTNPAAHVYYPFTGAGTQGKGTDW